MRPSLGRRQAKTRLLDVIAAYSRRRRHGKWRRRPPTALSLPPPWCGDTATNAPAARGGAPIAAGVKEAEGGRTCGHHLLARGSSVLRAPLGGPGRSTRMCWGAACSSAAAGAAFHGVVGIVLCPWMTVMRGGGAATPPRRWSVACATRLGCVCDPRDDLDNGAIGLFGQTNGRVTALLCAPCQQAAASRARRRGGSHTCCRFLLPPSATSPQTVSAGGAPGARGSLGEWITPAKVASVRTPATVARTPLVDCPTTRLRRYWGRTARRRVGRAAATERVGEPPAALAGRAVRRRWWVGGACLGSLADLLCFGPTMTHCMATKCSKNTKVVHKVQLASSAQQ